MTAPVAEGKSASLGPARRRRRVGGWDKPTEPQIIAPLIGSGRGGGGDVVRQVLDLSQMQNKHADTARGLGFKLAAGLAERLRTTAGTTKGAGKGSDKPAPAKLAGNDWEHPRSKSGLRLIGDMSPEEVKWVYPYNDESRRSFAGYLSNALSKEQTSGFFALIRDNADWIQPNGPLGPIPRKTAWMVGGSCSCVYRYGGIAVPPQSFPQWMLQVMQVVMPLCGLNYPHDFPDSCNVNLYEDGGSMVGWHSDDEPLFQGRFQDCRIISLSLGATRKFELRKNWPEPGEPSVIRMALSDGDLCTMEGMLQKHLIHRVPREQFSNGARINLTWRWIVKHSPQCPVGRRR